MPDFKEFPKIARLNREIVITEKIDGTNALIYIGDDFETIMAGSRTKWITPEDDNKGFAKWAESHKEELLKGLGPGYHYGEWWGAGIGRRYDLKEKRFSLFNVSRWTDDIRPKCCNLVPLLYRGLDLQTGIRECLKNLKENGSVASPGFMKPEGIVIYHKAADILFKITLENDESPKTKI